MTASKYLIYLLLFTGAASTAQAPQPLRQCLQAPYMKGAAVALSVKEVQSGQTVYSYLPDLEITPASVMKTVTTAAALEILGGDYTFPTVLEYDGTLADSVLRGNLYIRGSGDPTLGSSHLEQAPAAFPEPWLKALRHAGIRRIEGSVIADEGCFDDEGVSWKWVNEDLGSYYGAGSYGITVFDNNYRLTLRTGAPGTVPAIRDTTPRIDLVFHNRMKSMAAPRADYYLWGAPFSRERYLSGEVPAHRERYEIWGDIPDPALFLAEYVTGYLQKNGIPVAGRPACRRLLREENRWNDGQKTELAVTSSPPLSRVVRIVNETSQNLYADILLKTLGNRPEQSTAQPHTSFEKGSAAVSRLWEQRGLDVASLWMYDGSGLAVADKLTAGFLTDLLVYMRTRSKEADTFYASLPLAGREGTVKNFLKGSALEGRARLKSGSMSRVKSYAGYIRSGSKEYAVALLINNYACDGPEIMRAMEKLLLALFTAPGGGASGNGKS